MSYARAILQDVLSGIASHGTVQAFLEDEEASTNARRMYVADYVTEWLGVNVALTSADERKTLRDVHMTDNATVIVHYTAKPHVTYDDCAPFLANVVGFKDGEITSPWKRVVVAYKYGSTVCPELKALFSKGLLSIEIMRTSLQVFAKALVKINAIGDDADEADEADDGDADEADEAGDGGSASSTPRSRAL
jgi:hypothetical protein